MIRRQKGLDWVTFSLYLALTGIGFSMIYTVGYKAGYPPNFIDFLSTHAGRQLLWIGISLVAFFVTFSIEGNFWRKYAIPIYLFTLVLLVAVLFFGKTIKGATAWFDFGGGLSFQPSELSKFGTALALAAFMAPLGSGLNTWPLRLQAMAFFLVPVALIMLQPDTGSALVFLGFFVALYREGFPGWIFTVGFAAAALLTLGLVNPPLILVFGLAALGLGLLLWNMPSRRARWMLGWAAVAAAGIFGITRGYVLHAAIGASVFMFIFCLVHWNGRKQVLAVVTLMAFLASAVLVYLSNLAFNHVLAPHQQERILVWLKPNEADPQGAAYNLNHSKMAIGSGGLTGKGFLKGSLTQGNFVPEQSTDFIFCAVGEEQGFIGVLVVIGLYLALLARILIIGERHRLDFVRVYAYSIAGILFVHFFINIGMTMGLLPTIGIPLPFLSRGGSSLLVFTVMLAVLLRFEAENLR